MADPLQILLAFPPDKKKLSAKDYETQITNHIKELGRISSAAYTKTYEKKSLLELVDPAVNSVSYLYILLRQYESCSKDSKRLEQLYPLIAGFLTSFDPIQMRYAGEEWRMLFESTIQLVQTLDASSPLLDATPLVVGLLRLDPTAGTLTTNHFFLVQLCLSRGIPSQVLPILDKNIYAFPQKPNKNLPEELLSEEQELSNTFITTNDKFSRNFKADMVLEYYLQGALIYIGLRNFSRARLFLEYVLLAPTQQHVTSALQAEAYKKWVLVGLLAEGKSWPVPRTMDQVVLKSIRAVSKPYDALVDDFEKRNIKKFQAELEVAGVALWQEDGNLRLVNEAYRALNVYRIIDLQKTYAALPVSRVATLLGMTLQQTFQLVQDTIKGGYLNASVSSTSQDGVLRFHSTVESASTADQDLEGQTSRIQELVTYIRDADRRLQLTKEYVEHQRRAKRTGGPDGDLADAMDLSWDGPMGGNTVHDGTDEEDIMA